jgi:oxygen-dependent protoporphyrinogen oxidase
VGGGIAGLALGWQLRRRGVPVEVLEAAERPGGNIRSEPRGGWLCEWGPNGFLDNEPATLRLVEALGLRPQLAPSSDLARVRWIVRGGRLRELPTKPPRFLTSDVLSPAGRARVLLEWAQPARRDAADESVFDFARRRIGREAAEVLVDAMVTGVYAGDSHHLSLQAAFPRMRAMEMEHGGLMKAMMKLRRAARRAGAAKPAAGGGPMGPPGVLTSFTGGMETIVQALARELGEALHLGSPAEALVRSGGGWRLELQHGAPLEAEQVVLACPSWVSARFLCTQDAALAQELAAIPSAPVVVVCLGWKESDLDRVQRGFGFLVPGREKLGILGTLFDTWVFPNRSPAGKVLWRAMLGGARDHAALDLDDAQLVQRTLGVLERLLAVRAQPEMTYVVRHPRGIPQYPIGHGERLARLDEQLGRHPGLFLSGNSYRGIAMNACIKEAETLGARLAGEPVGSGREAG